MDALKLSLDAIRALILAKVTDLTKVNVGWTAAKLIPPEVAVHVAGDPKWADYSPFSQSTYLAKVRKVSTYDVYWSRGDMEAEVWIDFWGRDGNDLSSFIPRIKDSVCQSGRAWNEDYDRPYVTLAIDPGVSGISTVLEVDEDMLFGPDETEKIQDRWRQAIRCTLTYPAVWVQTGVVLHTKTTVVGEDWAEEEIERIDIPIT